MLPNWSHQHKLLNQTFTQQVKLYPTPTKKKQKKKDNKKTTTKNKTKQTNKNLTTIHTLWTTRTMTCNKVYHFQVKTCGAENWCLINSMVGNECLRIQEYDDNNNNILHLFEEYFWKYLTLPPLVFCQFVTKHWWKMCSLDGQYFKLRLFVHTDLSTKCTPPYLHIISTPTLPKLSSPAVHSKPPSTKHTLSKSPIATHPLQHTHPHTLIMSNTVSYLNGDTLIMDARKDSSGMIQVMAKNCRTFIFSGLSGDIIISMKSLRTKIKKRKKENVIMSTWNDPSHGKELQHLHLFWSYQEISSSQWSP